MPFVWMQTAPDRKTASAPKRQGPPPEHRRRQGKVSEPTATAACPKRLIVCSTARCSARSTVVASSGQPQLGAMLRISDRRYFIKLQSTNSRTALYPGRPCCARIQDADIDDPGHHGFCCGDYSARSDALVGRDA